MNSPMCQVSVIIPTYRHQEYVLRTLEAVFAQTFMDYEVIVINDGSPDDTTEALRPLIETGRIRYIEQPNAGQAAARNRGLVEARGKYIAFLDDDDLWLSDKLQWQVEALNAAPDAVLAYGYWQDFTTEPLPDVEEHPFFRPTGDVHAEFTRRNHLISPGQALIRADALRGIGGFDETLWGVDDWDLYIRLSACGEFVYHKRLALYYRNHAANASKDSWRMYGNARRMWRKHFGMLPAPAQMRNWWQMRRSINEMYFDGCAAMAQRLMAEGKRQQAWQIWRAILTTRPGALRRSNVRRSVTRCFLSHG